MPTLNLRLWANPKAPTAADPEPVVPPPAGADPGGAAEAAAVEDPGAVVREDQVAWEVPAVGRA
jgi:hypothetical protein